MRLISTHCHYIRRINSAKIPLRSDLRLAFVLIIAAFCVHVIHHTNREKVKVSDGDT